MHLHMGLLQTALPGFMLLALGFWIWMLVDAIKEKN
jgi:hypothetical protein